MPLKPTKQIGKQPKKDECLSAKSGKTFVTPQGREYIFNYRKEGRRYIYVLTYKGTNCQIKEADFNTTPTNTVLKAIDNEL